MKSLQKIFRIGRGPSSSHTMAPKRAAEKFKASNQHVDKFQVTLFESLAATGKGHLTDVVIKETLAPTAVEIIWKPEQQLPLHPNGMLFEALDDKVKVERLHNFIVTGFICRAIERALRPLVLI